jgi:hypothetical protein
MDEQRAAPQQRAALDGAVHEHGIAARKPADQAVAQRDFHFSASLAQYGFNTDHSFACRSVLARITAI